MKNRFDLIIFDWDGTLVDSIDWIVQCIQGAAARFDCPIPTPAAVKDIIGLSIEQALMILLPESTSEIRSKIAASYSQTFFSRQMDQADLFPGVYPMLQQFRRNGYRLAVATGKKSSGLAMAMQATGVVDLFCTTRCSDQTASKPDPLMINEIVSELGVNKQRTLMVGDSAHDMQMALNADVAAIAVTCGAHDEKRLKLYGPLRCLAYPNELIDLL